ncbi:MAG: hypothetical protein KGO50_14330 [Myxococcales bacterium]|nr:hypothetical protein [Myxococcales bacterium]
MNRKCNRISLLAVLSLSAALTQACTSEDNAGEGTVSITVAGGEAVRSGFPHTEGTRLYEFADGWEISFDRFIVSVGGVTFSEPDGPAVADTPDAVLVDLVAEPDAVVDAWVIEGVPALRHDVEIDLIAANSASRTINVSAEDSAQAVAAGATLWISGTATRGDEVVPFDFVFDRPIAYSRCSNGVDGTRGLSVPRNGEAQVSVSLHVIHLFETALVVQDSDLRFDAMAAMTGDDGLLTLSDLATQSIQNPLGADGQPLTDNGDPIVYNDAGLLRPQDYNLAEFLDYASRNMVHFNGLGLCAARWADAN